MTEPARSGQARQEGVVPVESRDSRCRRTACEAEQAALKDGSASSDEDPKKPDAAQKPAKAQGSACKSCEPDYKACMKRCFE